MKMRIHMKMKRSLAVCLLVVMVLSLPASFAARLFTDVPEDYWAMPYIIKVVENEIMPGYSDATYKPSKAATKLEVVTAIYNMVASADKFDKLQGDVLAMKFGATIDAAQIPKTLAPYGESTWAAVGYALENGIIHPDELKGFMLDGELAEATKVEATVFLGKALNIFLNENLERIVSFDYKDAISITGAAAPYIDLLIQNDVISSKGDDKGNFNPKQVVTREVLATLMSGSYAVLSGEITPQKTEENSGVDYSYGDSDSKTFEAIVSIVHKDLEIIEVRDGGGSLHVYDGSDADIRQDGASLDLNDVEKGMDVTVTEEDGDLVKLVVNKQFEKVDGKYESSTDKEEYSDGTYSIITVSTSDGKKYYKAFDSAVIVKDGETVELSDLSKGDQVLLSAEGYMLREVEAYSPQTVTTGVLNRTTDFKAGSSVSVQLERGGYIDQVLSDDIDVISGDDGIRKGDIVEITLEYGKVVKIEATGLSSELAGTIQSILISDTPQVVVKTNDGAVKTVDLKEDMDYILLGGDTGSIYDLRLDQSVTLKMDGNGANTLVMNKVVEKVKFKAEIVEIYQTANLLKVEDESGQVWTVSFKDGAAFSIMDYEIGDDVFVFGVELSDDLFEAEAIFGN